MARTQGERRRRDGDGQGRDREDSEFVEKLVNINRVAKVVKGGRRFGFAALVIVGDKKGRVGYGSGKAREVPEAIRKATEQARKSMIRVPLREGRTLHHDIADSYGAGRVIVRAAKLSSPRRAPLATSSRVRAMPSALISPRSPTNRLSTS